MQTQQVSLLSQGQRINGHLVLPNDLSRSTGAVIFLHGMTSSEKNYLPIAEQVAAAGFVGLTINLRGHEGSEGEFDKLTFADGLQDVLAASDYLTNLHFVDDERIGVCGGSFGAVLATALLEHQPVESLVLRGPAVYTPEMMKMTYKEIMEKETGIFNQIQDLSVVPSIKNIENFTGSLLIVASEKDQIIPPQIPQAYFDAAKNAKEKDLVIIKNATHQLTEPEWRAEFVENAVSWFEENL